MQRPNRRAVLATALGTAVAMVGGSPHSIRRARTRGPVRFGLTPVFLDSDLELLRDLEDYLVRALGMGVQLMKRRTYQEIMALLLSGQLDAAWVCGYPYVQHADRLALLAVPLHRGRPLYQSYLIADAAAPAATSIDDLRGRSHAFADPDSNSGFLATRWLLARRGTTPGSFFSRSFYAYGHRNVVRAVGAGLADSGSVDGYVWEVMAEREPELTNRTAVVAKSGWHGFPPVCCLADERAGPVAGGIADALIDMARSSLGERVLGTLRLDGFASCGPELFDSIARMTADIRASG